MILMNYVSKFGFYLLLFMLLQVRFSVTSSPLDSQPLESNLNLKLKIKNNTAGTLLDITVPIATECFITATSALDFQNCLSTSWSSLDELLIDDISSSNVEEVKNKLGSREILFTVKKNKSFYSCKTVQTIECETIETPPPSLSHDILAETINHIPTPNLLQKTNDGATNNHSKKSSKL